MGVQLPGIHSELRNSMKVDNCVSIIFSRQDTSLLPLILQPPTLYSSLTAPPTYLTCPSLPHTQAYHNVVGQSGQGGRKGKKGGGKGGLGDNTMSCKSS